MWDVFHNLKWFFRERAKDYVFCLISLVIVSVVPVFPTKLLGLFIDDISNNLKRGFELTDKRLTDDVLALSARRVGNAPVKRLLV